MTNQQTIQQTIIDELGMSDLPQEKQEKLLSQMTEAVLQRIFIETMQRLNTIDQEEYAKMVENKSTPDEIEAYLRGKIADYDGMIEGVVNDFKEEMKKEL
jgi:hypothetical protein